jgi:hypothetical protein
MPNPTWDISAAETATLTAMLDALPSSDTHVDPRQRLGYRTFFVDLPDRSVAVYGGFVRQTMDDHFRYFIDTDQRVERRLYATAKPHISDDLYRQLDTMITQGGWPARVELDIFADNENPTWALSSAETVTLTMMLDALPPSDTSIDTSQKTGYRSFLVHFPDRVVEVYGGVVRQATENHAVYFTDTDQRVERWLYATAKPHISDDLYQQLDTMITEGAPQ